MTGVIDDIDPDAAAGPSNPNDDRLNRNAAALVLSGILSSGFGFVFWVVAARTLSTDDVGTGTALVAALVLLASVSTLGMRNAFPRFLPIAGRESGRLIGRAYAACAVVAAFLGVVFVLGSSIWAPDLALLRVEPLGGIAFVVATVAWTIFVLQDSVLTGLRHASWVPIENLIYAVAKIVLLVVLASSGRWALMLAWAIPAVAVVAPLNALIFRRLVPSTTSRATDRGVGAVVGTSSPASTDPFEWRALVRFSSADHSADVVKFLGAEGVVLVVLAVVGPAQSAALFFAITIAASIQLVTSNIVSAFVAEASSRPADVDSLLGRAALHVARLVVPAALLGALLAPIALSIFGEDYKTNGTGVLRLLLLSLIPAIVTSLAIGMARFERRVKRIVGLSIAVSAPPLIGAFVFVSNHGVIAVGWSVLLGQTLLAIAVGRSVLGRTVVDIVPDAVITKAVALRDGIRHRRRVRAVASVLDELDAVHTTGAPLRPRRFARNTTDVVVIIVDHPTQPRVIKVALSQTAAFGLADHARALRAVRAAAASQTDSSTGDSRLSLLPEVLESGTSVGQAYLIETACPGRAPLAGDYATLRAAASALTDLQRPSARSTVIGDALLITTVEEPIQTLAADPRLADHVDTLERLRRHLDASLRGHHVVTTRTHGDFWLGNVLVAPGSRDATVTGIIDWEDSVEAGLPEVDLAHLWLSLQSDGLAAATLRSMDAGTLFDLTGDWIGDTPNPALPGGAVVLMAWLAHIASGLDRSSKFALGRMWLDDNVHPVLEALATHEFAKHEHANHEHKG